MEKLKTVDSTIYQIEKGRLIFLHIKEAYDFFNKDSKGSIDKADKNWPDILESHVGKPIQYDKPAAAPVTNR